MVIIYIIIIILITVAKPQNVPPECSRMNAKLQTMIDTKLSKMSARCLDDGSFDPLQCWGEQCTCVKRYFGTPAVSFSGEDRNDEGTDGIVLHNMTVTAFEDIPCCKQ